MMEEIRKRPFVRPLFAWITGIVLQVCFPLQWPSVLAVMLVGAIALCYWVYRKKRRDPSYDLRWIWGALFMCVLVLLAIQVTALNEYRLTAPPAHDWLKEKALSIQAIMISRLDTLRLSDREKSFLAMITVNYRQAAGWELRSRFATIGTAHLLSVSGFHVGIVCSFLSALFSMFPKRAFFHWLKHILLIIGVWGFAYISGLSAPAVRAATMLTIYLAGRMLYRRFDIYNTLAATAFCMLLYYPYYLFNVGFQLSFIAVFFIFYLQPRFSRLIEVRNPLLAVPWSVLTITVAAQIGVIFLCCYYFGEISTIFLFANLVLSLLATVLIPVTLTWMQLPPGVFESGILQHCIEFLTKGFIWFVDGFSRIPGATVPLRFDFVSLLCAYGMLGLLLCYFRSRRTWMLLTTMTILLGLICRELVFRY